MNKWDEELVVLITAITFLLCGFVLGWMVSEMSSSECYLYKDIRVIELPEWDGSTEPVRAYDDTKTGHIGIEGE